jgi:hypothetical protein
MAGTAPYDYSTEQLEVIRETKVHDRPGRRDAPSPEAFQQIVRAAIDDAEDFVDSDEMAGERERALDYYWGRPMGTEVMGRSSVVMTEVHDVVNTLLPGLMRVFTGNEHVVEFTPVEQNDVDAAAQATDYVDHIFSKENPGFQIIYDAAYDGLIKKMGVFKWWCEHKEDVVEERYEGLTQEDVAKIANEPGVAVLDLTVEGPGAAAPAY